jgi:hypothetical protein
VGAGAAEGRLLTTVMTGEPATVFADEAAAGPAAGDAA